MFGRVPPFLGKCFVEIGQSVFTTDYFFECTLTMKNKILPFVFKAWQRFLYPIRPYWTANIYGFGKWIRRYGFYPPVLPLCVYTDHGPRDSSVPPYPHELNSDAPVQFFHSIHNVIRWREYSDKPCHVLFSPSVFARRSLGINKKHDAYGTLFFVAHSTPSVDERKPVELYHEELSLLPKKFWPITICLHIHDVRKGLDKEYEALGYKVVTAGDSLEQNFIKRFYEILSQYNYALSNLFGSYALYATEMEIPFGLYGTPPSYLNKTDPNIESGEYKSYLQTDYYQRAQRLFGSLPGETLTKEQHEFALDHLGITCGINRLKMMRVLYSSLFKWGLSKLFTRNQKQSFKG